MVSIVITIGVTLPNGKRNQPEEARLDEVKDLVTFDIAVHVVEVVYGALEVAGVPPNKGNFRYYVVEVRN